MKRNDDSLGPIRWICSKASTTTKSQTVNRAHCGYHHVVHFSHIALLSPQVFKNTAKSTTRRRIQSKFIL